MKSILGSVVALAAMSLPALAGCSKAPSGDAPAASSSGASPVASAQAPASGAAAAPAASAAPATAKAETSWHGSYKSVAGTLTLPKGVNWRVPDVTAGVGDGAIALTVGADGGVKGTVDGPLGPATVNGRVVDHHLAARIVRSDPADLGFTGTLLGEIAGDPAPGAVTGTMNVALGDTSALRTAAFELKPGAGAGP